MCCVRFAQSVRVRDKVWGLWFRLRTTAASELMKAGRTAGIMRQRGTSNPRMPPIIAWNLRGAHATILGWRSVSQQQVAGTKDFTVVMRLVALCMYLAVLTKAAAGHHDAVA